MFIEKCIIIFSKRNLFEMHYAGSKTEFKQCGIWVIYILWFP